MIILYRYRLKARYQVRKLGTSFIWPISLTWYVMISPVDKGVQIIEVALCCSNKATSDVLHHTVHVTVEI